ncbi:MAG: hypothetical protein QCI82_06830 [Candidatus Thermoplasmatota archaeon]|nr:hypothetical protein [Candidatus Thermoplasmatota archaeon]
MERASSVREIIKDELDREDRMREEAFNASRSLVRICRERISLSVKNDVPADDQDLKERVSSLIASIPEGMSGRWGFVEDALAEAAEAMILSHLIADGEIPLPDGIGIPARAYVMGACDAVGELRRCILNALLASRYDRARSLFASMRDLSEVMEGLVYPAGMLNLKKKQDAVRYILDRTQGDLVVSLSTRGWTPENEEARSHE